MIPSDGADGGLGSGEVSVGQGDQSREAEMEEQQRREDDGIGVPPEANPHVPNDVAVGGASSTGQRPHSDQDKTAQKARDQHGKMPGQTGGGGLGGEGPVQP